MGEDSLRNRRDTGSENPELLWKRALNLARVTPTAMKESMHGRLKWVSRENDFLLKPVGFASGPAKDAKPEKIQNR